MAPVDTSIKGRERFGSGRRDEVATICYNLSRHHSGGDLAGKYRDYHAGRDRAGSDDEVRASK